jgi:RHS repeat-associated protein
LVSSQTGVQGVYSSTGALQELALYSLYGVQTIMSGAKVTPFGYQGSYTDSTGLIYLINRYYDATTDEFLSIDPDVADTIQPYLFTGDDPLNADDPTGLLLATGTTETHAETAEVAKATKVAVAAAKPIEAAVKAATVKTVTKSIVAALQSKGVAVTGTISDAISKTLTNVTTNPNNPISAQGETVLIKDVIGATGDLANSVTVVSSAVTSYNDVQDGHDISYAIGDGAAQAAGGWAGALAGAEACGETLDPIVDAGCAVVGGAGGTISFHALWHIIVK